MNSLTSTWAKRGANPALLVVWGLAAALVLWVLVRGGYLMSVMQIAAIYTIFVTCRPGFVRPQRVCRGQRLHLGRPDHDI
jgi:hypothetical protein